WGFNYSTHNLDSQNPVTSLHADILMLHDSKGLVAAMYPAGYTPDITTLQKLFKRTDLSPIETDGLYDMLSPLKPDAIELVIDETLFQDDNIYFSLPGHNYEIVLEEPYEQFLQHNSYIGSSFARPDKLETSEASAYADAPASNLRERIASLEELPAMPETAYHLLRLRNNPDATIEQLVDIIERDPALVAQIMRHANSAWYSSPQPVETTYDAIFRVIGFENAIYIALGSIIGKAFKLANDGPLGREAQWKQAIYSATLSRQLASMTQADITVKPGLVYLAALLHNIGVMVMAQLFRSEYLWLNKLLSHHSDTHVIEVEQQCFGITHAELGSLVLLEWCLPLAITTTALEHHDSDYDGPYQEYVQLVQVANAVLKAHNLSDADHSWTNWGWTKNRFSRRWMIYWKIAVKLK
ncbi:MAG: HDOD domain-containing protein, partial [Thioalkalispiraceae bacterium]